MKTPPEASHIDHRVTLGEGLLFKHLSGPRGQRPVINLKPLNS